MKCLRCRSYLHTLCEEGSCTCACRTWLLPLLEGLGKE